jgi:hypothetical protein
MSSFHTEHPSALMYSEQKKRNPLDFLSLLMRVTPTVDISVSDIPVAMYSLKTDQVDLIIRYPVQNFFVFGGPLRPVSGHGQPRSRGFVITLI